MQVKRLGSFILASALTVSTSAGFALAQDSVGHDAKAVGTDTKDATKDAGHGIATGSEKTASGTKKAYHKTVSGTKTAADKTADGTKTVADKTADGTKTVGKDIGHGTKAAAKDTVHGTEKVGDKIVGKPTPQ